MPRKPRPPDTTRRSWNKVPTPNHLWNVLQIVAHRHGTHERDLWKFLLRLVRERYPDDWADALKGYGVTDAELDE